ncbi:GNAT family N-acetyltransferase [Streptomyces mirabilis]|uniref:GNAT family N-acetyltransferase n=1 Tax=Streptomyces mirabilis TaxID=68239 RepID=UPI00379EEF07
MREARTRATLPTGDGQSPRAWTLPSGELQLDAMRVAPSWRGRGVGEAVIGAALDHAVRHGVTSMSLTVLDSKGPARSLHQRMGFHPTGERSPRPRDPSQIQERFHLTFRPRALVKSQDRARRLTPATDTNKREQQRSTPNLSGCSAEV